MSTKAWPHLTNGGLRTLKAEIKRDYDYLMRLERHPGIDAASAAPALAMKRNLIKRTIMIYTLRSREILVDGEPGCKTAKDFMKTLIQSQREKYANDGVPIFPEYKAENLLGPFIAQRFNCVPAVISSFTKPALVPLMNSGRYARTAYRRDGTQDQ